MNFSKEKALIYLDIAENIARFSHAERNKVGALIVSSEGKIVGTGYNGTPSGCSNSCETSDNSTFDYVIHAELNAIFNATTHNLENSTIFVTHSPCIKCASAIVQKKIKTVFFLERYRLTDGIEFLRACGIECISKAELLAKLK